MHSRLLSLLSLIMAIATVTTVIAAPLSKVATAAPAVDQLEAKFLTHMIVHHRGAVEMAQLAKSKATQPELIALAQSIIDGQQREIVSSQSGREGGQGIGRGSRCGALCARMAANAAVG